MVSRVMWPFNKKQKKEINPVFPIIEVGDIWYAVYANENPWKNPLITTVYVVGVKSGWVAYVYDKENVNMKIDADDRIMFGFLRLKDFINVYPIRTSRCPTTAD